MQPSCATGISLNEVYDLKVAHFKYKTSRSFEWGKDTQVSELLLTFSFLSMW